jgi:hypothetical protein
MNRTSLALIAVAVCAQLASADPQTERVRKLAAENSAALASGNYARLVDLTYPKVVGMIGGRDKMIETLRRGSEDMKAHGSAILGTEVGEPKEVVTAGDKQFAIVPMTVRVQIPTARCDRRVFSLPSRKIVAKRGHSSTAPALLKSLERTGENSRRSFQIFPLSSHCLLASRQSLNPNET